MLNNCEYCVEHHFAGLVRLLGDEDQATEIRGALEENAPEESFLRGKHLAGLGYARKLTADPAALWMKADVEELRRAGFDDGEILELNQVTAYFSYANRTVLGLGVNTEGDIIGLSPGDNSDAANWTHS